MEEVVTSELLSPILNAPMVTLTHSTVAGPLVKRLFCCKATLKCCGDCTITQAGRGENQRNE